MSGEGVFFIYPENSFTEEQLAQVVATCDSLLLLEVEKGGVERIWSGMNQKKIF
jgi:hypothetical protein